MLAQVWSLIDDNGFLFVNQTPFRYNPVETHITGLPFINYMPDRLAHIAATRFSKRIAADDSWEIFLRKGIRGATKDKIMKILRRDSTSSPVLLEPSRCVVHDRVDLWCDASAGARWSAFKKLLQLIYEAIKLRTGIMAVPSLDLAIRKSRNARLS